jgi:hypothetical protein
MSNLGLSMNPEDFEPPPLAMPVIPVHFFYCDQGNIQQSWRFVCTSVPRQGDVIFPQAGSKKLVVHVVVYKADRSTGTPTMIPHVFLREPTPEEERRIGSIVS